MSTPYTPVTEAEYQAAQKLVEDFWSQYDRTPGQPTRKLKDLGITSAQYDAACPTLYLHDQVDRDNISSHALAHYLLQFPDYPVVGLNVGQGSNEAGDDQLKTVKVQFFRTQNCITLAFGQGPMTC